jgi:hypothetical protein
VCNFGNECESGSGIMIPIDCEETEVKKKRVHIVVVSISQYFIDWQKCKYYKSTDTLRETQISQFYRYAKYHNFWRSVNFADMLEKSVLLKEHIL